MTFSIETDPKKKSELEKAANSLVKMLIHHLQILSAVYSIGMAEELKNLYE